MGRSAAYAIAQPETSVLETPRRVAFVTLGQSPRIDLVPEILKSIKIPIKTIEYGLLDDLDRDLIKSASPKLGEPAFLTHLRDGSQVELATSWAYSRFRDVYEKIRQNGADLVVLMSTTCGHDFRPDGATIISDNVVDRVINIMACADLKLGVVVPTKGLLGGLDALGGPWPPSAIVRAARHGDPEALSLAINDMSGCDVIVLHSMGYSDKDRAFVQRRSGKPTIINRRIIANAIRDALEQLDDPANEYGKTALLTHLRSLSNREREMMFYVADGLSNKQIARHLNISFRTVEIHRARMMEKMAFHSITDLVRVVDMVSDL